MMPLMLTRCLVDATERNPTDPQVLGGDADVGRIDREDQVVGDHVDGAERVVRGPRSTPATVGGVLVKLNSKITSLPRSSVSTSTLPSRMPPPPTSGRFSSNGPKTWIVDAPVTDGDPVTSSDVPGDGEAESLFATNGQQTAVDDLQVVGAQTGDRR